MRPDQRHELFGTKGFAQPAAGTFAIRLFQRRQVIARADEDDRWDRRRPGGKTIAQLESGRCTELDIDDEAARQAALTLEEFLRRPEGLCRDSNHA